MKAKLVVVDPRTAEPQIFFARLPAVIGRSAESTVRLDDRWVSRSHCLLDHEGDSLVVRDLGSKYGTLVNRNSVLDSVVGPDDELLLGLTSMRASLESDSADQLVHAS